MVVFHIDTKGFPASYVCYAKVSPKIKMTSWRSSLPRFLKVSTGVQHLASPIWEHARHQCKSLPILDYFRMAAIEQYNAVISPFRVFMNCAPVWLRLHVGCYIAGCESKLYNVDANPIWVTKLHKINPESNGQRFAFCEINWSQGDEHWTCVYSCTYMSNNYIHTFLHMTCVLCMYVILHIHIII